MIPPAHDVALMRLSAKWAIPHAISFAAHYNVYLLTKALDKCDSLSLELL
jgi:hypothetical protein